jgi:FkbM family methyltransferase
MISVYQHILGYLTQKPNPTIFELGVHWAEDTHRIMSWCQGQHDYHGFEPDNRNIAKIKQAIAKHNLKMTLNHGAISDKVGESTLYLSDGIHVKSGNQMTGANSIRKPKDVVDRHKWIDFSKTQRCKTYTLDTYCKDKGIKSIDFIWSDIQGCEYDMIVGAKEMLPNIGMMLLEYSNFELYEGQKALDDIYTLLGDDWEVVMETAADTLVINKNY